MRFLLRSWIVLTFTLSLAIVGCGEKKPKVDLSLDQTVPFMAERSVMMGGRANNNDGKVKKGGSNQFNGGLGGVASSPTPSSYDRLQQEQYSHFDDNNYRDASAEPVTTFSTDVNTASYSNMRRFLEANKKLPPKDSVRIAELVNYFPYEYSQPVGADPVSITLELAACAWQPKHLLARIGLKAKEIPASDLPPRNFVFLVDVSGSMQGATRLPLVKKSLNMLIDTLRSKDIVSIVTYAGDTSVRLSGAESKERIREVVHSLDAGGSTNGGAGIELAYNEAKKHFIEKGVNRVILCTDGDFNVGITSEGELIRLIEQQRSGNVFLTVLGYGMGNIKDSTLEKLANHGNGHYAYIDSESEARKVFVEQGGALTTVAKDVKLQLHFNPTQVKAYRLIGYENRMLRNEDFKNDGKDAGDIGSGLTVTAFFEIVPVGVEITLNKSDESKYTTPQLPNENATSGDWLTVMLRYKHPTESTSQEMMKTMVRDTVVSKPSADFRFGAAVVEFGLLLRESKYRGVANFKHILNEVEASSGYDPGNHRKEFSSLVKLVMQYTSREDRVGLD